MTALRRDGVLVSSRHRVGWSDLLKIFRRNGIEAGGGGWRLQSVSTLPAPHQSTLAARGPAKARAAALSMNNPIAARAVEAWTAALVGKGWQVQSQHPDRQMAHVLNCELEAIVWPLMP